jgi:hypothetical protein
LRCPVEYMDVTEGSRAKLGYLVGYMDVTEGSRAKLGYLVGCIDVTEGSRAKLWSLVGYIDATARFIQLYSAIAILATCLRTQG